MKREFKIKASDGKQLHIYEWKPAVEPIGVLQIFHGMAEHAGRYARFAKYLNKIGYIVYANDHRGHGKTAGELSQLGVLGEDGFNKMVTDEFTITERLKKNYPKLPLVILAHSMGSFVAQEYITRYGDKIDGAILSGTAKKSGFDVRGGAFLAKVQEKIFGREHPAKLIDRLSFSGNNKKIENVRTKSDWLSRDEKEVDKYEKDKYCGALFNVGFYSDFFTGLPKMYKPERLEKIPKDLPVYIFAGEADPVGNYGKSVKDLYELYNKIGIKNLKMKLYPGGRHEMLNEINRDEVFEDVVKWLKLTK